MSFAPHFNGKVIEIRALGYNLFSCILELVDNSISTTCGSKNIRVILYFKDQRLNRITVMDDGVGMSKEQLCEAIVLNLIKPRDAGDIGKFHVGMKYSLITMGSEIIIITKKEHSQTVGVRMNIEQMQEQDTFEPTEICDAVDDTWVRRYITSSQYEEFKKSASGTYIEVRNLVQSCRTNQQKILADVTKSLSLSYSNIPAHCHISVESQFQTKGIETPIKVYEKIKPYDLFYKNAPQLLDEPVYSTTLTLYRHQDDVRLIETVQQSRKIGKIKETGGEPLTPLFYEHKEIEKSRKLKSGMIVKKMGVEFIPISKKELLSMKEDRIDVLDITVIQVEHSKYIEEKELFSEDSKLLGDRKGVYFLRDSIRCVGSAKQLGFKLHDRTQASVERQRMQVKFTSKSDEHVGSTFNKQMSEYALPCSVLNNALMNIYKQVTNPWNNKWKTLDTAPKSDSDSEDEDQSSDAVLDEAKEVLVPIVKSCAKKVSTEINQAPVKDIEEPVAEVNNDKVLVEELVEAIEEAVAEVKDDKVPAEELVEAIEEAVAEVKDDKVPIEEAVTEMKIDNVPVEELFEAIEEAVAEVKIDKVPVEELVEEAIAEVKIDNVPVEKLVEVVDEMTTRKEFVTLTLSHFTLERYNEFSKVLKEYGFSI
jgi:hypothetical protein